MELLADPPERRCRRAGPPARAGAPAPAARRPAGAAALHARATACSRRGYACLLARLALLKLRYGRRLQTDGLCFICPGVKLEIGRGATLRIGRWAWIGHGCKIRVHEGEVSIGAKTVIGQECTISAYQHVSIGRECIIADRVMLIDFDHGVAEVERPIRLQGIYKRDVRVGHNVWIGYGACILRGVTVGDNCDRRHERRRHPLVPGERGRRRRAGARDPHARRARARCAGSRRLERLDRPPSRRGGSASTARLRRSRSDSAPGARRQAPAAAPRRCPSKRSRA